MTSHAVLAGADKIRPLFDALERECSAYCVLAGYDCLPDQAVSDIDFMVSDEDYAKLPQILAAVAQTCNMSLVQHLQHETTACYYILASAKNATITFLHPDATTDYRRHGRLWMDATGVLARRRMHPRGFWIPSAADAFLYYLIKRIDKRLFESSHGDYLSRLYSEAPAASCKALSGLWPADSVALIARSAEANQWGPVIDATGRLADQLISYSPKRPDKFYLLKELLRQVRRVVSPTGIFVVCLGPDGVGKSTVIDAMETGLRPGFRRTARFHLRPKLLKGSAAGNRFTAEPHAKPNRGVVASTVKLMYFVGDYTLAYWLRVRPMLVRSTLVLFDRYFFDLSVDTRRFRYGGPAWLVNFASRMIPSPDIVLVFDAPAEIIHARKQELSLEEIERQRKLYLEFARRPSRHDVHVIDASKPLEDVITQCYRAVLSHMEERTFKRLDLADLPRSYANHP